MTLTDHIRTLPDFPRPGIRFRDVTTLMLHPEAFGDAVAGLAAHVGDATLVAGIEARGFVFGASVAARLGLGFLPLRKPGKLPGETVSRAYTLEYGEDALHAPAGLVAPGTRVLLVDDLIATGGTCEAGIELVRRSGGELVGCGFVIELPELGGRAKVEALEVPVHALVAYAGH